MKGLEGSGVKLTEERQEGPGSKGFGELGGRWQGSGELDFQPVSKAFEGSRPPPSLCLPEGCSLSTSLISAVCSQQLPPGVLPASACLNLTSRLK